MGVWGAAKGLASFTTSLANFGLSVALHIGVLAALFAALQASGQASKEWSRSRQHVLDLVYWKDPKKSGLALGLGLLALIFIANYSLISVVAYAGLLLLAATVAFKAYKFVMKSLGKASKEENPLKTYLDKDLAIPDDRVHAQVDHCLQHAKGLGTKLRSLILVEEPVETVKFGLLLWALTYVGAALSGITLLALALIAAFTIPKIYELYQPQIDEYWNLVAGHLNNVSKQVEDKVPFLKKKQT